MRDRNTFRIVVSENDPIGCAIALACAALSQPVHIECIVAGERMPAWADLVIETGLLSENRSYRLGGRRNRQELCFAPNLRVNARAGADFPQRFNSISSVIFKLAREKMWSGGSLWGGD